MKYSVFGATHVGNVRDHNEDAFYISEDDGFMIVSDGMGGLKAGEVASSITRDTIAGLTKEFDGHNIEGFFKSSFNDANAKVKEIAESNPDNKGMGCTCVALYLGERDFCIAHVGDSRIYLFRDGNLKQITKDHSYVEELFSRGLITEEEKIDHPYKNSITRYIGSPQKLEVDIKSGPVKNNDLFLLCTDGLTGEVEDEQIIKILNKDMEVEKTVEALIENALENGGGDNVTIAISKVEKKKEGFFKKMLGW